MKNSKPQVGNVAKLRNEGMGKEKALVVAIKEIHKAKKKKKPKRKFG